jgi:gliding motility-associated-like protein/uncharacterized delta-60 repeat protein
MRRLSIPGMSPLSTGRTAIVRVAILIFIQVVGFTLPASAQYTKILDFTGSVGTANGGEPANNLFFDGTYLYGLTRRGGVNDLGTIFKIKPDGTGYVKMHEFTGGADNSDPIGGLVSDGTFLYGATRLAGTNAGTIFKIKPDGTGFTTVYTFPNGLPNPISPSGSLIYDGTFLYGMTSTGGSALSLGTVFKIKTDGTGFVQLTNFGTADVGRQPSGKLFSDGTYLYGVTERGGTSNFGVVFRILPDGTGLTKLHEFNGANGRTPLGGLTLDGSFLYGFTEQGGNFGDGTLFRIKTDGTSFSKLFDFQYSTVGSLPQGVPTLLGSYLYGMTFTGGASTQGNLFRIKPDGTGHTPVMDFNGPNGNFTDECSLLAVGSALYGMTSYGGANDLGTVFEYYLGPPTITSISPTNGPVGASVTINGNYFSTTPANNIVHFGGIRANVTAATANQLTVTVPAGAAHDRISVMVNGLSALSNDLFVMNFGCSQIIDATSFAPKVDLAAGIDPYAMAQADFDQDGKIDMVSANYGSETVSLFRNTSTGPGNISFSPKQDIIFLDAGRPYAIATGDYDGDGKLDFAVASEFTNEVSVFRNNSTGPGNISFAAKIDFPSGSFPHGITAADFNNDGRIDVAVTSNNLDVVSVFANTSTGPGAISFAARVDFAAGNAAQDVAHADLDGDGRADLVVTNYSDNTISVLRNTSTSGSLSFAPKTDLAAGDTPNFVSVGDIDQDGKLDVAVANAVSETISVYRNTSTPGTITLAPKVDFPVQGSFTVALGDVSGDGKIDLVVPDFGTDAFVRQNTSTGPGNLNFATPLGFTVGSVAQFASVGDFDLDGKADIAVVNQSSQSISVLRNSIALSVSAVQRNALIALYTATDGANWTDNTGWLSADESTWVGITVTGCDVTDISLPGNNLIGSLPAEIGDLPMLEGLDLGANQLSGSIPPEIGNLTNLIGLNLAINQLDGFLPPELGNLASLEVLNLSFNNFNGTPPIELENLASLTDAALNNNQFSGQPPLIGGSSAGMSTLQLQFNSFNGLPNFSAYASISLINVANNRLTFDDLEPFIGLPNFFYDPQAQVPPGGIISFIPGGTLNIPFSTGGSANSYQWYKDNVLIPGATSASLSLPGMTTADVGFYQVKITSAVVPFLVLESVPYTVITDPCAATTPTSGDIDAGFAPLIDIPSTFSQVELQSTGKIITESGGTMINSVSRQGLLRFLPDGTLDNTFTPNVNTSPFLVQPNDQILASYYDGSYAYLVRMDANGNEDAAFTANVPQYYSGYITAVALQSDNKILVAANEYMSQPFIQRLNPDGTADGFLPDATGLDVNVIRIQTDGHILVGGQFPGGIIRLDPTGNLDPTFFAETSDFVSDIAIQSDGKILVGGQFQFVNDIPKRALVRLLPDGSIDNTFTALGITNLVESGFNIRKIALQTDGKIVLAGEFESINGADRKNLVRLNLDGTVDCLFDAGVSTDLPIVGLALPSDSQILISGSFENYDGTQRFGLARINSSAGTAISITLQPADATVCEGAIATFQTAATGTTGITYQWQFSPDGIVPYADIADGGGYSGVSTATLSINTTGGFGAGRYRCRINGDLAAEVITLDKALTINPNPAAPGSTGGSACTSGAIVLTASGAAAGQYRWYTVPTGGTALPGEVNATYTTPVITVTTTYYVSIHNGACESVTRTPVVATINTAPPPPTTTGASSCVPAALALSASGGLPGEYRWYATATGGTDLGSGNDTFTTPVISVTTTYHVALNNGTCESSRTPVAATIEVVPKPAIITSNCTATGATLTGPAGFTTYAWSNGATTQAIAVTAAGTYTLIVTSSGGCTSPASDPVTFTAAFCNQPPVLQPTPVTTTVQGTVTINVSSIATDLDNNIDLSTLQVIAQPTSGANAFINASFELVVDYSGVMFAGTDQLTIELCDVAGACVQEVITIEVAGDITVYNALSPNGDGKNDVFFIEYINALPDTQQNKVTILNRWGSVVFEAVNYDNTNVVFRGLSDSGTELPSGTYYYVLEFSSGAAKRTGFISLRR